MRDLEKKRIIDTMAFTPADWKAFLVDADLKHFAYVKLEKKPGLDIQPSRMLPAILAVLFLSGIAWLFIGGLAWALRG